MNVYYLGKMVAHDNEGYTCAWNHDTLRYSTNEPRPDYNANDGGATDGDRFGSSHPGGMNIALCDGSVRFMNYSINFETFKRIGNKRWNKRLGHAVRTLDVLLRFDRLYIGGGNSRRVELDLGPDEREEERREERIEGRDLVLDVVLLPRLGHDQAGEEGPVTVPVGCAPVPGHVQLAGERVGQPLAGRERPRVRSRERVLAGEPLPARRGELPDPFADLRDAEDIDYVFYVTAHEVAHQWWAHQVMGGDVQGSTVLVETMAQYSALMVMEKEYGRDKMRRFLKYELDNYLRSRGSERIKEMPLMLVENQGYIHYRKGSLVMYAMREYLGEDEILGRPAYLIETTYDEEACAQALAGIPGKPDLAVLFFSAHHADGADVIARTARERLTPGCLLGCSGEAVVGNDQEVERRYRAGPDIIGHR